MKIIAPIACLCISISLHAQTKPKYEIYALQYAQMKNATPISDWVQNGPADIVSIIFMFWLVKGDNGKIVLVDTGFLKDIEEARDFGIVDYIRPDSVLSEIGLKAEHITDIIITHPHWDHADGLGLFPNAHAWIQKDDYSYLVGEAWQKNGQHGGFNKRDMLVLIDLNVTGKLTLVPGDNIEIMDGIRVYTGSRHTYDSQYVLIQSNNDKVIIASDNIWIYYNLEKLQSAPSYGTFDPKGYVSAMKRMKSLASDDKFIIPGHDKQIFDRFKTVAPHVVRIN